MIILLRLIGTLGIFIIPSFIFARLIITSKINRLMFSLLSSIVVGIILFLLVIVYVHFHPISTGLILFVLAIPGTFPISFLLYPGLKSRIELRMKKQL
jgi:hypothetical protein